MEVNIQNIKNPRKEKESHYYNPQYTGLMEIGLEPNYLTEDIIIEMLRKIIDVKSHIDIKKIQPRVNWS